MTVITWVVVPAIPLMGAISERIGRPWLVMLISFGVSAVAILAVPFLELPAPLFAITAVAFAMAAGNIMALPGALLRPESRAVGTGIFFTWYYVGMTALPPVAGLARDLSGDAAAPVLVGGLVMASTLIWLGLLRLGRAREPAQA